MLVGPRVQPIASSRKQQTTARKRLTQREHPLMWPLPHSPYTAPCVLPAGSHPAASTAPPPACRLLPGAGVTARATTPGFSSSPARFLPVSMPSLSSSKPFGSNASLGRHLLLLHYKVSSFKFLYFKKKIFFFLTKSHSPN